MGRGQYERDTRPKSGVRRIYGFTWHCRPCDARGPLFEGLEWAVVDMEGRRLAAAANYAEHIASALHRSYAGSFGREGKRS